jgi:hypothetical protein
LIAEILQQNGAFSLGFALLNNGLPIGFIGVFLQELHPVLLLQSDFLSRMIPVWLTMWLLKSPPWSPGRRVGFRYKEPLSFHREPLSMSSPSVLISTRMVMREINCSSSPQKPFGGTRGASSPVSTQSGFSFFRSYGLLCHFLFGELFHFRIPP